MTEYCAKILIIDDDEGVVHTMSRVVEELGYDIDHAFTLTDGLSKIYSVNYDIILLDVNLPDGSGLDIIGDIVSMPVHPQIIIMTAFSDPDGAELAIESGAWDYIEKPASYKKLKLQISRALQFQEHKKKTNFLTPLKPNNVIGRSRNIKHSLEKAAQFAKSEANVLITGETGTGKELFAKIIHENSNRCDNSFIVVDCSLLSENLIESVLFGHEKGSFTGADKKRNGLVKLADNGTLFLDEIGELPQSIQSSFLRVLQEKKFRPVGGEEEEYSNFRIIAATNKNLDQLVDKNKFRSDLLYRLKTLHIELPPLRVRKEDIRDIVLFYTSQFSVQYGVVPKEVSDAFVDMLIQYDWPGNVRELANSIESSILSAKSEDVLYPDHIPQKIRAKIARASVKKSNVMPHFSALDTGMHQNDFLLNFKELLDKTEKEYLTSLYSHTNGDIHQICSISGISRTVLYRKMKKYHIQ